MNDFREFIAKHTNEDQRLRGWGLLWDEEDNIPPNYRRSDFFEMSHFEIGRFFRMSDAEKFEFAYWTEKQNSRRTGRYGFIFGVVATLMVVSALFQWWLLSTN